MPWVQLRPSEIYFLHDSIDCRFRDGRALLHTFDELLSGKISVSDIQRIAVFYWDERQKWHIYAGNRRLYLYKILEELGVVEKINVWKVWTVNWDAVDKKNTTVNGGISVEIRNDHNFDVRLREVIKRHKGDSYFKGNAKVSDKEKLADNIQKRNSLSASEKDDLESMGSDVEYDGERGQELNGDAIESDAKYVQELTGSVVMYDGNAGPESSVQVTYQPQITLHDKSDNKGELDRMRTQENNWKPGTVIHPTIKPRTYIVQADGELHYDRTPTLLPINPSTSSTKLPQKEILSGTSNKLTPSALQTLMSTSTMVPIIKYSRVSGRVIRKPVRFGFDEYFYKRGKGMSYNEEDNPQLSLKQGSPPHDSLVRHFDILFVF
ncbi:uncharacterized protein [Ptychodera flava]|uniref:uncharacterized protein n=1 Tax=Ptychodera flava TaxID=63121 RepID=UPI003969EAA6